MVKQVIWSNTAKTSKQEILSYWTKRNKSNRFSKILNKLLKDASKIIGEFPLAGKSTGRPDIRIKIVRDYLIFYKISDDRILILFIWDGRRNPEDLQWTY